MRFSEKSIHLKDGRPALLRSPCEADAAEMLDFVVQCSGETDFLMRYPEEYADYTLERERELLRRACEAEEQMMIACLVEGSIAGNCQIVFRSGLKDRHRASVAIALRREFWGLGIGTALFRELIRAAKSRGCVRQLELDFIEGNSRARGLYEKMGFRITGVKPDAIRLKDGRLLNEYSMVKVLDKQSGKEDGRA